jgi:hypothetical protein
MARNTARYDEDFYVWSSEQARLLRAGDFARLDVGNIAEELESMGRGDKREIDSRLVVLIAHLLKWRLQVGFRSAAGRRRYARARRAAADETGPAEAAFPADCPFTADEILAEDFLPES